MKKFFLITIIAAVIITAFIVYGSKHDLNKPAPAQNEEVSAKPVTNVGKNSFADDSEKDSSSETNPTPYGKPDIDEEPRDILKNVPLKELAGPVHNEYGIRDDILEYIKKTIPRSNEMAMKATIIYAASLQFIYYGATEKQAFEANKKSFIALKCLRASNHSKKPLEVTDQIDALMRNSPERDARMWDIDKRYFGWKILGLGDLSDEFIKKACETGDY